MSVAVIVPYRAGQPERDRNWAHVRQHYADQHPDWELIHADTEGRWSKGAAVNAAAARTDAEIRVIADADSILPPETLREAVGLASSVPWIVPHRDVYRLTEPATVRYLTDGWIDRRDLARARYEGPAGGGIAVLTREAFDAVGGIDPRFYDWGGEDICWGMALDTLVGHHHRIGADLIHLWHPHPSPNYDKPPESRALIDAYVAARLHPGQMRAVLAGTPYEPPAPCPERRFRTPRPLRTCHVGTERIRFKDHQFTTTDPDLAEAVLLFPNVEEVT